MALTLMILAWAAGIVGAAVSETFYDDLRLRMVGYFLMVIAVLLAGLSILSL